MSSGPVDLLIVGGGPTGAALANLAGARGLSVVVVERNVGVLQIPRAVHLDGETMRVFQAMGLAADMMAVMRPGHGMHWVDSRGDTLLVRKGIEGLGAQGWHGDYYFHQPRLESVLREGVARYPHVQWREGVEMCSIEDRGDVVRCGLRELASQAESAIEARYVVGCDGARSAVRAYLGDAHEDLGLHQAWLVVDGVLNHPLPLPEYSVQHCDPARPATSIYVHPLRRRWEVMVLPGDDLASLVDPENVWRLLARWVRPGQARLERAATYMFHSLVAETWQRGRVMIAGDAAHQTPPFLGQGLCAGIRDAANLAWKLAWAVSRPDRADAVVSTYGPERKPHAREFVQLAVDMGHIIQVLDENEAAARDERLKSQGLQFFFPTPRLGAGMHEPQHSANGRVFPQPMLQSGHWLDDVAKGRFALLMELGTHSSLPPDGRLERALNEMDVVLIVDDGAPVRDALRAHDAVAVLLRPDGYVFDACPRTDDLTGSMEALGQWLI